MNKFIILGAFCVVAIGAIAFVIWSGDDAHKFISQVYYSCRDGKQIRADYYEGPSISVKPGEMPRPSGSVSLVLSDGRKLELSQTISASGIRYADVQETVIFWSKGQSAFIVESNQETYSDCRERMWTLGNESVDEAVMDFLLSRQQLSWKTQEGSTNLCVFQNLMPEQELFPYYLWVRCGEFKSVDGEIKELSGTSVPAKVDYPNGLSFYDLNRFTITIPRDGSLYDKDVRAIFPDEIQDRLHFESGPLNDKIWEKARALF